MATTALDLFVFGIQKIVAEHCRVKEPESQKSKHHRGTQVNPGFIQKSKKSVTFKPTKKRSDANLDTESNSSNSSYQAIDQPVIWVDIVKKLPVPEEAKKEVKPSTRKVLSFWGPNTVRRGLLPDSFQIFIQKNLNLIAEVQMAKRRRSDNSHIFRQQENDINWTSKAPRPQWSLKPFTLLKQISKNRLKKKSVLELPEGIRGIHLKGRQLIKTTPRQPRPRSKKSAKKSKNKEKLNWGNKGKRVTFQIPNTNKIKSNNRGRKCCRRRTRKKSKVATCVKILEKNYHFHQNSYKI